MLYYSAFCYKLSKSRPSKDVAFLHPLDAWDKMTNAVHRLTITLPKDNLGRNVLRSAEHLHVFELSAVFVNGALVQVGRHCNNIFAHAHAHRTGFSVLSSATRYMLMTVQSEVVWLAQLPTTTFGFNLTDLFFSNYLWLGGWVVRVLDLLSTVVGLNPGWHAAECNPGQVVYTHVPLSSSSIIWYLSVGGDAWRLGR